MRISKAAALVAVSCAAAGCATSRDARDAFVKSQTCPANAVTVARTTRPAWLRPPQPPAPPAEVVADPARLKLYRQQNPVADYDKRDFWLVQGCGHQSTYMCYWSTGCFYPEQAGSTGCWRCDAVKQ